MTYQVRVIEASDYPLLDDFIYEAIFIPEGVAKPDKSVIHNPDLQVYIKDFGKHADDTGVVVEVDQKVVGAAWVRIMNDYGHVDNETPSLAISLYPSYRGLGYGRVMMVKLLEGLKAKGYVKTSLAVQKKNYAFKFYQSLGYEIVDENEEEYIMVKYLQQ